MDVNVNVTIELGEKTAALLTGGMAIKAPKEEPKEEPDAPTPKAKTPKAKVEEPMAKPETPKAKPETPKAKPEGVKMPDGWDDMDDDAKLEAIRAKVTKHTRVGGSADIKFLLSNFDAGKASELDPEDYDDFFIAIVRYGNGEKVDSIFPGDLE